MAEMAFVNEKTGKRYKVVNFDQTAGKITLVGEAGVEFTESYNKELFQRLGYKLQAA
jgi:hypothetical protein